MPLSSPSLAARMAAFTAATVAGRDGPPSSEIIETFDATQTAVVGDGLIHVLAWYDNEWDFSNRMVDAAVFFGALGR